jgi:hypothetical protein
MSNKLHKLRIVFSVVCGIVCLLLIALWVRSYQSLDLIRGHLVGITNFGFISQDGKLFVVVFTPAAYSPRWVWYAGDTSTPKVNRGAQLEIDTWEYPKVVRYWFLVAATGVIASTPWICRRFSLRALLIGMTLIAVLLGVAVLSSR